MSGKAVEILDAMLPPSGTAKRTEYRPYATQQVAVRSFEELRGPCAFFHCDISRVVTRVMNYQFDRAKRQHQDARQAERARKRSQP